MYFSARRKFFPMYFTFGKFERTTFQEPHAPFKILHFIKASHRVSSYWKRFHKIPKNWYQKKMFYMTGTTIQYWYWCCLHRQNVYFSAIIGPILIDCYSFGWVSGCKFADNLWRHCTIINWTKWYRFTSHVFSGMLLLSW